MNDAGSLFSGKPEEVNTNPPWLATGPPSKGKEQWPDGAFSPSWLNLIQECPRAHAKRYREKIYGESGFEAAKGLAIHGTLDSAAKRRTQRKWKGALPVKASTDELLHLLEFEPEAQKNPAVLAEAREVFIHLGPVDFTDAYFSEAVLKFQGWAGVQFACYADLIKIRGERDHPTEVEITDYKGGPGQVIGSNELFYDPQAQVNMIAARRTWPTAQRITFKLWNVAQNQIRVVAYTPVGEKNFIAFARACMNVWNSEDEEARPGIPRCKICDHSNDCDAYQATVERAARAPEVEGLEGMKIEDLIEMYRTAQIAEQLSEKLKKDVGKQILEKMGPDQDVYRTDRLRANKMSKGFDLWTNEGASLVAMAEAAGVSVEAIINEVTKGIGSKKLRTWVSGLPDDKRGSVQAIVEDGSGQGRGSPYIQITRVKGADPF